MSDNDILIARKTEGGCRTVVIDGDTADFERQNRRVKERQATEEARRKEEAEIARRMREEKEEASRADFARRRRKVALAFGLVLSAGALMAMTLLGLMHTVVGMAFIAGDAAAFGYQIGGAR
ncbi:MAG: hypothetical protein J6C98_05830 [Oscillospiraceae bacterium]|nr:hypothetical protein [Oscillospiraceae bacterium]